MAGAWITAARTAHAYSDPRFFFRPVYGYEADGMGPQWLGGSEGRWFTGSPAEGYACDACHTALPTENPKLLPPMQPPRGQPLPAGRLVVDGLPKNGYVAGESYTVRVTWPEYAARARVGHQTGQSLGFMGIVAEVVGEDGTDSGFLAVAEEQLGPPEPSEKCIAPSYLLSTQLYRQPIQPYVNSLGVTLIADRPTSGTCTAADGTRCLIVVVNCGAEQARFVWTAPRNFRGAIWFSAGYVATDHRTSDPREDSVTLVSIPMAPASEVSYTTTLAATSCSLSGALAGPSALSWSTFGVALWTLWRRSSAPRRRS